MKKMGFRNKMLMLKTINIILVLNFGVSLFSSGAFADTVCKSKCCDQNNSTGIHHNMGNQIKSLSDCHSNLPLIPCDLQSGKTVNIPECTLTTSCSSFQNTIRTIEILSNFSFDNIAVQGNYWVQTVAEKFHSPPYIFRYNPF